jgi:hypothetical protein
MYKDGKRIEIGFADFTVLPDGDIVARGEVTQYVPELQDSRSSMSFSSAQEEFSILAEDTRTEDDFWARRINIDKLKTFTFDGLKKENN